jgi:uncharacterized membrane protein YozB (DUF420 family)
MHLLMVAHIFLMATATILIIAAVMTARKKKPGWLNRHRAMALTGAVSACAAFACVFISKAVMHYAHFYSPHSIAGAVTLFMLVVTPITGALVVSGTNSLRPAHRLLGRITSLVLVLTVVSGIMRFIQISRR